MALAAWIILLLLFDDSLKSSWLEGLPVSMPAWWFILTVEKFLLFLQEQGQFLPLELTLVRSLEL